MPEFYIPEAHQSEAIDRALNIFYSTKWEDEDSRITALICLNEIIDNLRKIADYNDYRTFERLESLKALAATKGGDMSYVISELLGNRSAVMEAAFHSTDNGLRLDGAAEVKIASVIDSGDEQGATIVAELSNGEQVLAPIKDIRHLGF